MTINSTGPVSLGGSTVGQSVNLELGRAATAQANLNDSLIRHLAGKRSGTTVLMSDFRGKTYDPNYWRVTLVDPNSFYGMYTATAGESNNIYVAGTYRTGTFPSQVLRANVTKLDSTGNRLWERQLTSTSTGTWFESGISDSSGNFTASGAFTPKPLLARWDSAGNLLWQRIINVPSNSGFFENVNYDAAGNIIAAGRFNLANVGDLQLIAKFNTSGSLLWVKTFNNTTATTTGGSTLYEVVSDANSNIFSVGKYQYTSNTALTYPFIVKLNSSGTVLGSRGFVVPNNQYWPYSLAVDSTGNIFMTIYSQDFSSVGAGAAYIIKLDNSLNVLWQRSLKETATSIYDSAAAICTDSVGNVYFTANLNNSTKCVIASCDTDGNLLWIHTLGSNIAGINRASIIQTNKLMFSGNTKITVQPLDGTIRQNSGSFPVSDLSSYIWSSGSLATVTNVPASTAQSWTASDPGCTHSTSTIYSHSKLSLLE